MNTAIKYKELAKLPTDQQLKKLSAAVGFELSKPEVLMDIVKNVALMNLKVANDKGRFITPTHDQIKTYLAVKYSTASDTPLLSAITNQYEQYFHTNMPEMDLGYMLLFDLVDMRGTKQDSFEIMDTNAGVSWTQRLPGERTKLRKRITEAETTVKFLEYSDGIGILDRWIEYQKWWRVDEVIAEFRANYFDTMAVLHYGLLTSLGAGVDQAFSADDVTTANNGKSSIMRALKGKGLGTENPTFYAVCAPEYEGRLEKMLTAQRGSAIVDQGTVNQPLTTRIAGIITTTHVPANDTGWYLVLPNRKMKRGIWKDLTTESQRDIYVGAENIVGVGQYNCVIGEQNQIRRCKYV